MLIVARTTYFICQVMAPGITPYSQGGVFCQGFPTFTDVRACKREADRRKTKHADSQGAAR